MINSSKLKNLLLTKALKYDNHLSSFTDEILQVLGFKEGNSINLYKDNENK